MSEPSKIAELEQPVLPKGRYFRSDGHRWRPASEAYTRNDIIAALDRVFPDTPSLINKKIRMGVDLLLAELERR